LYQTGSQGSTKGAQHLPPLLGPCLLWPRSPISATAELLYNFFKRSLIMTMMMMMNIITSIFTSTRPCVQCSWLLQAAINTPSVLQAPASCRMACQGGMPFGCQHRRRAGSVATVLNSHLHLHRAATLFDQRVNTFIGRRRRRPKFDYKEVYLTSKPKCNTSTFTNA